MNANTATGTIQAMRSARSQGRLQPGHAPREKDAYGSGSTRSILEY